MSWTRRHLRLTAVALVCLSLLGLWLVELVRVGRSVEEHRRYWSQPRGEAGGLLYVALGDSAAQGIGASRPDKGYVGVLADRLREATGRPVQVVNLSASGARTSDLLRDQLPRLQGLRPDVVTVAIGGNDVRDLDLRTFSTEVDRMTAALPPGALVADVPSYMHGRWQRDAEAAADVVRRSARARGLTAVRLHEALVARGWRAMLTDFAADWFHPNDRGHRVWADAFWSEMGALDLARAGEGSAGAAARRRATLGACRDRAGAAR